ncbi:transposase [Paenibacillus glycanilyticus]|uniref:transposase n=1 Tax=Paenibacillus glycanilyticus TaxID=126569 RepID=UPI0032E9D6D3
MWRRHRSRNSRGSRCQLSRDCSGKWRGKMVLSKRGRPRLRHFLYLMTMSMLMTNTEIRASHRYNVEEKNLKKMKVETYMGTRITRAK